MKVSVATACFPVDVDIRRNLRCVTCVMNVASAYGARGVHLQKAGMSG